MANTSDIPDGKVLPPEPNLHLILDAIAVALASLPGADGIMLLRAEVALTKQHSKGYNLGKQHGYRDGYQLGYQEGVADGRREALDHAAREEAESVLIKASALGRPA